GINYFDTSPDYGKGKAETNLGRALKVLKPKGVLVSTKVEIMPEDMPEAGGSIEDKIVRSVDASLERLQLDAIDVLMIHNPPRLVHDPKAAHWIPLTKEDFLGPCLEGLEKVRAAGKARHFGFTCENAEAAATKSLLDTGHFGVINCWYNIVNPTAGLQMPPGVEYGRHYDNYDGIITHAGKCDVGVAVIRPLSGGALTPQVVEQGAAGRHRHAGGIYTRKPEAFSPEVERGRAFAFLHKPPRTLPVAAYVFALMHPAVSTIVAGPSDLAQLEEVAATPGLPELTDLEMAEIRAVYGRNFDLG
ncbi:MAG: hypothetical protein RLZ98_334, partial [Pseudomonadota bacterium]